MKLTKGSQQVLDALRDNEEGEGSVYTDSAKYDLKGDMTDEQFEKHLNDLVEKRLFKPSPKDVELRLGYVSVIDKKREIVNVRNGFEVEEY